MQTRLQARAIKPRPLASKTVRYTTVGSQTRPSVASRSTQTNWSRPSTSFVGGAPEVLRMPLTQAQKRARARRLQARPAWRKQKVRVMGMGRYGGQPIKLRGSGAYNWSAPFRRMGSAIQTVGRRMVPRGTFATMGNAAGSALGSSYGPTASSIGGALGRSLGSKISSLVGFGAYNVRSNTLVGSKLPEGAPVPGFGDMDQATIVAHREYIGQIKVPANPTEFFLQAYRVNPGNTLTFPWLSNVANGYDQYQLLGAVFEFKSTSGDSTNPPLGSITMATEYVVSDPPFTNKMEMANSQYAMTGKPTQDMAHPIECDPGLHPTPLLNIYSGNNAGPNNDPRWYDHCIFQIATEGLAGSANQTLGELWLTYQVALYKPTLAAGMIGRRGLLTDHFTLPTNVTATTSYFTSGGAILAPNDGSSLGGRVSGSTYTWPSYIISGNYFLFYNVTGASTNLVNAMTASLVNCTNGSPLFGTAFFNRQTAGTVSFDQWIAYSVRVTGSPASITFTAGTLPTGIFPGTFIVAQIDSDTT